jgi:hypothetical protein
MSEAERGSFCERCGRPLVGDDGHLLRVSVQDEQVERLLCLYCLGAMQQFLAAREVPASLIPSGLWRDPLVAAKGELAEPPPAPPPPASGRARAGWFAFRLATYGLIAVAVFALVTWLSVHG